jgi:hypothetical protein
MVLHQRDAGGFHLYLSARARVSCLSRFASLSVQYSALASADRALLNRFDVVMGAFRPIGLCVEVCARGLPIQKPAELPGEER